MITLHDILYCVLLPAAISLVLMLLAWRPWSGGSPKGHWAGAVAIGLSFSVGILGLQTRPDFPPASAEDWLFHVGWMIAIIGLLDGLVRLPLAARIAIAAIASSATLYLVLRPQMQGSTFSPAVWSVKEGATWIGLIAAGLVMLFVLLDRASDKLKDATVPLLLTMSAGGLGLYMMFNGSQTYGQRAGIIAAAVGPIVLLAFWSKNLSLSRGGVLAFVVLFGGLLATCYAYPDKPVAYRLALIGAAPIVGLIPALLPVRGWKRWIACALLAAIPLGVAIVPAAINFAHEYNAPKDLYGY